MRIHKTLLIFFLALVFCALPLKDLYAGGGLSFGEASISLSNTDTNVIDESFVGLFYVFDLRERETFIQLTYPDKDQTGAPALAHIQIFDVSNNCNENDFFDDYTPSDTHIYNMRDIQTNDGNPSGVVLPEGAYGIVAVTMLIGVDRFTFRPAGHLGNVRIIDNNGYEYRTNAQNFLDSEIIDEEDSNFRFYSFNYNQQGGVSLSDVYGLTLFAVSSEIFGIEWIALPAQGIFTPLDIDIYDLNEVPFSCRDIIFSCVDQDNPLLEEVLAIAGTANIASFEYGINDAIPHSKGGELLCPNNIVSQGTVVLRPEPYPDSQAFMDIINSFGQSGGPVFMGFVGLNNGNGRGSMDSFWVSSFVEEQS